LRFSTSNVECFEWFLSGNSRKNGTGTSRLGSVGVFVGNWKGSPIEWTSSEN
jgi:hypothetical protein